MDHPSIFKPKLPGTMCTLGEVMELHFWCNLSCPGLRWSPSSTPAPTSCRFHPTGRGHDRRSCSTTQRHGRSIPSRRNKFPCAVQRIDGGLHGCIVRYKHAQFLLLVTAGSECRGGDGKRKSRPSPRKLEPWPYRIDAMRLDGVPRSPAVSQHLNLPW